MRLYILYLGGYGVFHGYINWLAVIKKHDKKYEFMRRLFLLLLLFVAFENVKAQTVVVNPDGTHSIIIDNGSTKTIVNPDGTHTTIIDNGSTKIIVNPDGTHSTVIDNDSIKTIVNPDRTNSTVVDNDSTKTIVKRQKRHKKNNR